jgi:hypothetical protein
VHPLQIIFFFFAVVLDSFELGAEVLTLSLLACLFRAENGSDEPKFELCVKCRTRLPARARARFLFRLSRFFQLHLEPRYLILLPPFFTTHQLYSFVMTLLQQKYFFLGAKGLHM